jgi:anti-anti-sigma factor
MKYVTATRRVDPQTTVVTCQGEMDSLAVEELHQAVDPLLADSVAHLVFDLGTVEYISSSILSFLMASQAKAQEKGGKVSLVGASDLVKQVFEMAALDGLFAFYGTMAEAGVAPVAQEKDKGKGGRKERKETMKGNGPVLLVVEGASAQRQEEQRPAREKLTPVPERRVRDERSVEKIQPLAEPKSWRDYAVWIGIGVLVVVSVAVSLYLYAGLP